LIDLAQNLYGNEGTVDVADLIDTLDSDLWAVAVQAMVIRRGEA